MAACVCRVQGGGAQEVLQGPLGSASAPTPQPRGHFSVSAARLRVPELGAGCCCCVPHPWLSHPGVWPPAPRAYGPQVHSRAVLVLWTFGVPGGETEAPRQRPGSRAPAARALCGSEAPLGLQAVPLTALPPPGLPVAPSDSAELRWRRCVGRSPCLSAPLLLGDWGGWAGAGTSRLRLCQGGGDSGPSGQKGPEAWAGARGKWPKGTWDRRRGGVRS